MDFEKYLPNGAKASMIQERIKQLASEGLANEIAEIEAIKSGNLQEAKVFSDNAIAISAAISAHEVIA
jgi:hypothetical protein